MVINKIPTGTRIYLKKKIPHTLYIQPDKTLVNDNLYVAYDVKIDGQIVIPKGIRVVGDWVTESSPVISAQLQVSKIYLQGSGQQILADSEVYENLCVFNGDEIGNRGYFYKTNQYRSLSNITRRIIKSQLGCRTLMDDRRDSIFIEIPTSEIIVTLTADFVGFPLVCKEIGN